MIKLIFTFLFFCASSSFAQIDVATVRAEMEAQQFAWNNGDIPGFMEYYWKSDSLKFIGSKGITYGWNQTLANYKKSYPDRASMGILTFKIKECSQLSPSSIYVIGSWDLMRDKPVGGYFTLLWKKINDKWVIVSDHTS